MNHFGDPGDQQRTLGPGVWLSRVAVRTRGS